MLFGLYFILFVVSEVNRQNPQDGWICFHEPEPSEIKAGTRIQLKNNVMICYWYTFEPHFLFSFSAVPLDLTRFTQLTDQQF